MSPNSLRPHAEIGDVAAISTAVGLVELLAEHDRLDELRQCADASDVHAADLLAGLLAEHGRVDDAIAVLRRTPAPEVQAVCDRMVSYRLS